MELLIFRHGIAEEAAAVDKSDFDRALTPHGIERTTRAAHGLAHIADRPAAILTSPKFRAVQTARILGEAFDLAPETCDVLAQGDVDAIRDALRTRSENRLLIVGHEPTLSELVERLCVGNSDAPLHEFVDMKQAGCALVEGPVGRDEPAGPCILRWLIPPRVLRALNT